MPLPRLPTLISLALLAACGGGLPSDPGDAGGDLTWHWPDGLAAATPRTSYALDESIPVVFHNGSDSDVTAGALSCTSWLERRDGGRWVPLGSTRLCIQLAVVVDAGTDLPFTVDHPDRGGTYRVAFDVLQGGQQVTVRTGSFAVW